MAEIYKVSEPHYAILVYAGPGYSYDRVGIIYGKDNERYTVSERQEKYWLKIEENQWIRDRDSDILVMKKISTSTAVLVTSDDLDKPNSGNNSGGDSNLPNITGDLKSEIGLVSTTSSGLMAPEDKVKLDGIMESANNYVHPDNHPATMISEDETHRFVTDEEKAKLNSIPEDAVFTDTVYTHPDNHPATMISEDETHRFVTDEEKAKWDASMIDLSTKTFDELLTDSKTIIGAINELKTNITNTTN